METRFVGSAGLQVSELCWGRWPHQLIMRAHLQRQPRLVDATTDGVWQASIDRACRSAKPTLLRALPRRHKRKVFVAEPHYMG